MLSLSVRECNIYKILLCRKKMMKNAYKIFKSFAILKYLLNIELKNSFLVIV